MKPIQTIIFFAALTCALASCGGLSKGKAESLLEDNLPAPVTIHVPATFCLVHPKNVFCNQISKDEYLKYMELADAGWLELIYEEHETQTLRGRVAYDMFTIRPTEKSAQYVKYRDGKEFLFKVATYDEVAEITGIRFHGENESDATVTYYCQQKETPMYQHLGTKPLSLDSFTARFSKYDDDWRILQDPNPDVPALKGIQRNIVGKYLEPNQGFSLELRKDGTFMESGPDYEANGIYYLTALKGDDKYYGMKDFEQQQLTGKSSSAKPTSYGLVLMWSSEGHDYESTLTIALGENECYLVLDKGEGMYVPE